MNQQWQQQQMQRQRQQQQQMQRQKQIQQQMQRQQEQMRQQQERLRQQQMGAAWLEQQKVQGGKPRPAFLPQEKDRFTQVEVEVNKLRQEVAAGRLGEEQFKARLHELMVQDAQGTWWMVGAETGGWYRHDGANWVQANRPGRIALRASPQSVVQPVSPVKTEPRRFWGSVVLLLGLAITFAVGLGAGSFAYDTIQDDSMTFICAGAVWLVGLIQTIRITRKVWRRE
ncbi:MAG: hypothetical protein SWK90_12455 [Chloroflexota bacterium]|nr:hypothetical protein [Chloroflexota bacterium]